MNKTIEITDRKAFIEWLSNCPVDYEFYDRVDDDDQSCDFYYFRIPKEDDDNE